MFHKNAFYVSYKVTYFIASLYILKIFIEIRENVDIELRILSLSKYSKIKQYEEDKQYVLKSEGVLMQCLLLVVILPLLLLFNSINTIIIII